MQLAAAAAAAAAYSPAATLLVMQRNCSDRQHGLHLEDQVEGTVAWRGATVDGQRLGLLLQTAALLAMHHCWHVLVANVCFALDSLRLQPA